MQGLDGNDPINVDAAQQLQEDGRQGDVASEAAKEGRHGQMAGVMQEWRK